MPSPRAAAPSGSLFKTVRILLLLLVLLAVSVTTCHERYASTRWRVPLYVAIYPIAADSSAATAAYVAALDAESLEPIERFMAREAARYGLALEEPVKMRLRPPLEERPPERPAGAGALATALWSLKLRFWAARRSGHAGEPEDIRLFVLYHDPERTRVVPHSLGLAKGMIGVVYCFATRAMQGANEVVIAHEMLHTLGASDKYDPASDAPLFPQGYGDPQQVPLYPQSFAELMAGRRMLSRSRFEQAESLDEVLIGPATALEIRWPVKTD